MGATGHRIRRRLTLQDGSGGRATNASHTCTLDPASFSFQRAPSTDPRSGLPRIEPLRHHASTSGNMTATDPTAHPVSPQTPDASGSFKVGDVLVSSGGWEQTNISFYQVVAVTPKTVVIRALQSRTTAGAGEAQQMNEPIIDSLRRHRLLRRHPRENREPPPLPPGGRPSSTRGQEPLPEEPREQ